MDNLFTCIMITGKVMSAGFVSLLVTILVMLITKYWKIILLTIFLFIYKSLLVIKHLLELIGHSNLAH